MKESGDSVQEGSCHSCKLPAGHITQVVRVNSVSGFSVLFSELLARLRE